MPLSETIDCYRQLADSCVETRKFAFLVMAHAWSDLANQVKKTTANLIASPPLQPEEL